MDRKTVPVITLPNELWIEIFKSVDYRSLLRCSRVCKQWNSVIFQHLAHRFQLNLDPSQRKFPQCGVGLVPERNYKHLHLRSTDLDNFMTRTIERLAPYMESLALSLESLDMSVLMQIVKLCTRLNELRIQGYHFKYDYDFDEMLHSSKKTKPAVSTLDLVYNKLAVFGRELRPCNLNVTVPDLQTALTVFPAISSLSLNITNLGTFDSVFHPCLRNVTELSIVVHEVAELSMVEQMASKLKILKIIVHEVATEKFLKIRLPALEVLSLKLDTSFKPDALRDFFLGCSTLKTALLTFAVCEYQDVFPTLAEGLPLVEKLQISSETVTSLDGLDQMEHLKELSLKGGYIIAKECYQIGTAPTLDKFECHDVMLSDRLANVLKRFPNLHRLLITVRELNYELKNFARYAPRLKEFTLTVDRANLEMVELLEQMARLEKLVINAGIFAKSNFHFLRRVIVLPLLKSLAVNTNLELSAYVTGKVAALNPSCMLLLNGQRVKPTYTNARRSEVKRMKPNVGGM